MARKAYGLLFIISLVLLAIMIYGIYEYKTMREASPMHALAPWGLMVTGYVFFAFSSGGVYDALAIRLGLYCEEEAKHIARKTLWLALALIVPGIVLVFADLLHTGNSLWIYLGFHPSSRIAWNGVLYIVYVGFALATLVYTIRRGEEALVSRTGRALLIGGLLSSLTLEYNLSLAFRTNMAVPAWFTAPLGVFGIALAFLLGAAWTIIGLGLIGTTLTQLPQELWRKCCQKGVAKELAGMAVATGFFTAWILVQQHSWGLSKPAAHMLLAGSLAPVFWASAILAIAVPIMLGLYAASRASRGAALAASIATILGGFLLYHSIVAAGQASRLETLQTYKALAYNAVTGDSVAKALHELLASRPEALAVIGGVGLWLLLFILGLRLLAIEPEEKPRRLLIFR